MVCRRKGRTHEREHLGRCLYRIGRCLGPGPLLMIAMGWVGIGIRDGFCRSNFVSLVACDEGTWMDGTELENLT